MSMIMVVDDEPGVLVLIPLILGSVCSSDVITCSNGFNAIEEYSKFCDQIDFVVLDMIMPGLSGREVFEELHKINPKVRVILSTGYADSEDVRYILDNSECSRFLEKPFSICDVERVVTSIMEEDCETGHY